MLKNFFVGILSIAFASVVLQSSFAAPPKPMPESVKAITQKVADWQIKTFDEHGKYRALPASKKEDWRNNDNYHDLVWNMGALYVGMQQWSDVSGDPKYTEWLKMIGERNDWKLHERPYHADDHAVGQFYLSLYQQFGDSAMLKPTQDHFDWILAHPKTGSLTWGRGTDCHDRWGWCDALFMAPPVWARLAKVTGDPKYLDFMDQEFHATFDMLWDQDEKLFWRDSSYFKRREKNGEKFFWARGNGWVLGGLALMIPDLPQDWEGRQFYVDLYKQMSARIKEIQRDDGTWSMGLLGGSDGYPMKETSGTSFFTFGLAWGVNNGLLDRATYEPVVLKAWQALNECVTPEGMLVYVQPVGAAPGDSFADKTEVYGIGAFLAAGTEVYKMVGGTNPANSKKKATPAAKDLGADLTTFMKDGGWCWFQDPRAIIHDDKLFIGAVKGNGTGQAQVGVYDLAAKMPLGTVLMQTEFDGDDHNSPVFHVRPDGSVLATYAKHNRGKFHFSRISDPSDPLKWSEEFKHARSSPNEQDQVTYMNLYELADEGKLYNFYRGIEFNPTFVTSTDHGETWSGPVHFLQSEVGGRQRPYVRYAGNGKDTIYVSTTDAHPRDYGNSIYYCEFRDGNFYKADGTLIKNLKSDGPLRPSEAERVFQGSGQKGKGHGHGRSAPNAAWTSSIMVDQQGHPHIGYTLYLSNTDHRYRIASWDGDRWHDREVAYAGNCLYTQESSYTGLITLDPVDPTCVFISTNVDPSTGDDRGNKHQVYRAKIDLTDHVPTIHWKAVTQDSPVPNLRPIVLRDGKQRVVLWNRGRFTTYSDYDLDTVGFTETVQ